MSKHFKLHVHLKTETSIYIPLLESLQLIIYPLESRVLQAQAVLAAIADIIGGSSSAW